MSVKTLEGKAFLDFDVSVTLAQREKYPYLEFFWSVFSRIRTEYGEILLITPYPVQMRENTDQKNSEHRNFIRSVKQITFVN